VVVHTGVSCLIQVLLIFPALFVLSSKLKSTQNLLSILKWAGIATPLFVFGFWVRHGLLWVYAISPLETPQASLVGTFGFADSLVTLLVAVVVCTVACLAFWVKKRLNIWLAGTAITGRRLLYDLRFSFSLGPDLSCFLAFN
jgi:hypothetical protein